MLYPTYLLDSSVVIDILNAKRGRRDLARQLVNDGATLASCPIPITEVYAGLRRGEETKTDLFLKSLKFFPVTWEVSKMAGDLLSDWRQRGRTLSLPDVTIAAVALSFELLLITSNEKDFPMPELRRFPLP